MTFCYQLKELFPCSLLNYYKQYHSKPLLQAKPNCEKGTFSKENNQYSHLISKTSDISNSQHTISHRIVKATADACDSSPTTAYIHHLLTNLVWFFFQRKKQLFIQQPRMAPLHLGMSEYGLESENPTLHLASDPASAIINQQQCCYAGKKNPIHTFVINCCKPNHAIFLQEILFCVRFEQVCKTCSSIHGP